MPQPLQPQDDNLTKKGTPRKIAPGSGRPFAGRNVRLSMVTKEAHQDLMTVAEGWECTQAMAIEKLAALQAAKFRRIHNLQCPEAPSGVPTKELEKGTPYKAAIWAADLNMMTTGRVTLYAGAEYDGSFEPYDASLLKTLPYWGAYITTGGEKMSRERKDGPKIRSLALTDVAPNLRSLTFKWA